MWTFWVKNRISLGTSMARDSSKVVVNTAKFEGVSIKRQTRDPRSPLLCQGLFMSYV
jgi:hypothetical protein